MQKTYLSGVRASGRLHIGNYLGAVRRFVTFQEQPDARCLYFVADYHALTTGDGGDVAENAINIAVDFLAAGVDPNRSSVYLQSSVPAIAELSLLLSMLQGLNEVLATPTFKEKAKKENVALGLVNYPVLMAADILGVRATHVPVGKDQTPHIELAKLLARKVNRLAGTAVFPVPTAESEDVLVPGLGGGKMGKSESTRAVPLSASRDEVARLYARHAASDPARAKRGDPGDPKKCPAVFPMYSLIADGDTCDGVSAGCKSGARGCGECKAEVARRLSDILEPFQERRLALAADLDYVRDVLGEGARVAGEAVSKTVLAVRDAFKLPQKLGA